MRLLVSILALIASQAAFASTFIGNGGSAGDVELQMTLAQTEKTLEYLDRDKSYEQQKLCVCTEQFEGRPLCDMLKQLNADQVRFCSRYVRIKAAEIVRLLSQKNKISFSWTHESIEVHEKNGLRGVDAVTNPSEMSMILNQNRFLEMNENERVFLVGHELFHLTSFQGKTLSDEGSVGPFVGPEGGRQFINAMAATLVMQANEYQVFSDYKAAERRSKNYKKTYISFGYSVTNFQNDTSTAFDIEKTSGSQFGVRYQWTPEFGLLGQLTMLRGNKTILTTIEAVENRNILGLGVAYRWLPFSNPLTILGQSHFVFSGTVDFLNGTYEFHDPSSGATSKTSSAGYTLACNYFIPFNSGLWGYLGIGHSSLHYSYNLDNQIDLNYKNNGTTFALGLGYGF